MIGSPIYILHIISNTTDMFKQLTFSMCINEFMDSNYGHFEKGAIVPDELERDIIYHREFLDAGYMPPHIIVDLIKWMEDCKLWNDWMGQFDTIAIMKQFVGE